MGHNLDVLISGAGLVGGVLACTLAKRGLRVGLVDIRDPGLSTSPDDRSFAISYGSFLQLQAWGIWANLRAPLSLIQKIRVTQHKGGSGLTYDAEVLGYEALGFMVPSQDLHRAVWETVQSFPTVIHYIPKKIASWDAGETAMVVTLESGEKLTTKLLVGAEGRQSALREALGGATWKHTYDQAALVFTVSHSESHNQTAFEHFTSEGPLAFLPLTENRSAVVWSLRKPIAQSLAGHPDILLQALFQHFGWGLGDLQLVSIHFYPLNLVMPLKTWGDRLVLVGDAAHVLHPVAGQGLNVGLRDVAALAKNLGEAYQLGLDIGSATLLKKWATLRRFDQWSMAAMTHGIVGILGCEGRLLRKVCDAGFWALAHCAPLRKKLMRHAMGLSAV